MGYTIWITGLFLAIGGLWIRQLLIVKQQDAHIYYLSNLLLDIKNEGQNPSYVDALFHMATKDHVCRTTNHELYLFQKLIESVRAMDYEERIGFEHNVMEMREQWKRDSRL